MAEPRKYQSLNWSPARERFCSNRIESQCSTVLWTPGGKWRNGPAPWNGRTRCAPCGIAFSRRRNGTKRGGGFSHVAVRSCAPWDGGSFVREPRLLRPSITLTPGDRGMENGTARRRASRSTLEKRKLTLNFQGDHPACFLCFSLFPAVTLFHGTVSFHFLSAAAKQIALSSRWRVPPSLIPRTFSLSAGPHLRIVERAESRLTVTRLTLLEGFFFSQSSFKIRLRMYFETVYFLSHDWIA